MKSAIFECSLLVKVHKSVGFGSAERCNDNIKSHKKDITISTSLQVLQYLRPSTRVLTVQYWSTDGEVLDFVFFVCDLRLSLQCESC